ncbi:MAG: hypothetical protein GY845_23985 [Planctomycetes bacterium]|nr:hypothetical protein [Planctomycetota bacterium]
MHSETNCKKCSPQPDESDLTTISEIDSSRICTCNTCGSYWIYNEEGWDLLLSDQEEVKTFHQVTL